MAAAKKGRDQIPGTISICRPSNADSDVKPMIRIYLRVSGKKVGAVEMTAEDFALAITGRSEVPACFEIDHLTLLTGETR